MATRKTPAVPRFDTMEELKAYMEKLEEQRRQLEKRDARISDDCASDMARAIGELVLDVSCSWREFDFDAFESFIADHLDDTALWVCEGRAAQSVVDDEKAFRSWLRKRAKWDRGQRVSLSARARARKHAPAASATPPPPQGTGVAAPPGGDSASRQ